jgi:hypothetical protein
MLFLATILQAVAGFKGDLMAFYLEATLWRYNARRGASGNYSSGSSSVSRSTGVGASDVGTFRSGIPASSMMALKISSSDISGDQMNFFGRFELLGVVLSAITSPRYLAANRFQVEGGPTPPKI